MEINKTDQVQFPSLGPVQANKDQTHNQNGNILIVIGVIMFLLIVGGVAYYFVKSKPSKLESQNPAVSQTPSATPIPSSVLDETANWKTYINNKYGFSLKYPGGTDLDASAGSDFIQIDRHISLYVSDNSFNLSCINYKLDTNRLPPEHCQKGDGSTHETLKVNGVDTIKVSGTRTGFAPQQRYTVVIIPHGKYYYEFQVNELSIDNKESMNRLPGPIPENELELFDQIIATFKFTN